MQHLKEIVLPNYPLILSLLKYRNVWVFWNKKKSGSNRCSPLNSSIDIILFPTRTTIRSHTPCNQKQNASFPFKGICF